MRWPRRWRIAGILLLIAAAQVSLLVIYRAVEDGRRAAKEPTFRLEQLPSAPAPELVLAGPDGATHRLGELRGKAVLLHFWATWCPPCREELPGLLELGRELGRDGKLEVVAVTLDDDWARVRSFFEGHIPTEVLQDKSGLAARDYDVSTLPDTYLVARDGTLVYRFAGARNWRASTARELLARHLLAQREL